MSRIGKAMACLALFLSCSSMQAGTQLSSPDGNILLTLSTAKGVLNYSVDFNGRTLISDSELGLKARSDSMLKPGRITRTSGDETWSPVWGIHGQIHDRFEEVQLNIDGPSDQVIIIRAYDDGVAIRYRIPESRNFSDEHYQYEATQIAFESEQPKAWFPLSGALVSDVVDVNTWEPKGPGKARPGKNQRYEFKPSYINTPFTLKLSDQAFLSVHEAGVTQSDMAGLQLAGHTLSFTSDTRSMGGNVTPWRTITIADRAGGLIESTLIYNLNEPSKIEDTSWIKPGVTLWDWRTRGAIADDGFEYGFNTESYIRLIDFAAEANLEYLLIDAGWYGPEHSDDSNPTVPSPELNFKKVMDHAKQQGVGIWLYINTTALRNYDIDVVFSKFREWGVVGIKQGFTGGSKRENIEFDLDVVKKSAEHRLMYIRHEAPKPTGIDRTWPNILSYEYINALLDSRARSAATPGRVINSLFTFGLAGPVDRSSGMFDLDSYITRQKARRQIPATVVSQLAQGLIYPSGLLTLPDTPDAYRRKADLFDFVSRLPMTWDATRVIEAEIGKHITLARRHHGQWFICSLADEGGHATQISLDFLDKGVVYDTTLYEDSNKAHYAFIGPASEREAKERGVKLKPQSTRREHYQVRTTTVSNGDTIPVDMAPGGGHCMWLRPHGG